MTATATQSDAALLAELNGALGKTQEPTLLDPAPEQPPTLDQQLETRPPATSAAAKPQAKNLDKTFSKSAGGNGYRVTVAGDYYAKSTETKGNIIKKYKLPFNLPSLVNAKGEAPLGVIVGKLLKPALSKLDPLAVTFRTHEIINVEPLGGAPEPTSIQYMNFDVLKDYVKRDLPDFPVDVEEYFKVEHLREDVIDFKTNTVSDVIDQAGTNLGKGGYGVKKTPSERILERHVARKEERALFAMNEGLES